MPINRPVDERSRVYLVDGSGYIFRAYHALPPLTRPSDRLPVGAVYGFTGMLYKLLRETGAKEKPTHLAVVFDRSEITFRNELYTEYKAHRPPAPEDLAPQFPLVRRATEAFGLPSIEMDGYEADDIIATYARQAEAKGAKVVIVSSDKDLMQLVSDRVTMLDTMKNKVIDRDGVIEKFGCPPEKVIEAQALIGDSTDNVPGAPGIGPKTACQLLEEYGDLDTLLARASEIKQPKRRESIMNNADLIRISRELVTLKTDTPVEVALEDLGVAEPDAKPLLAFLKEMEFRTLVRRVEDGMGVQHMPAPERAPGDHAFDRSKYICIQSVDALRQIAAAATAQGYVGIDAMTTAGSCAACDLVGLALALAPNAACYVPLGHKGSGDLMAVAPEQIPIEEAIAVLKPMLEDPSVLKIGHNVKQPLAVLLRYGVDLAPVDDPMLLSYVIANGLRGHGLEELSDYLMGHRMLALKDLVGSGKAERSFTEIDLAPATEHAAEIADVALRTWLLLKPEVFKAKKTTAYETLERPMPAVLAQMELAGVRVDTQRLSRLSSEFAQKIARIEAQAHEEAGRPFNIGSPKQIGDVLFGDLGLPGGKKTKTGAWSTDVKVLDELAEQGHALPRTILEWRLYSKLKSTYTDTLGEAIDRRTGRVHTSFALAATPTGRLSSVDPNLQNIPVRTEEGRKIRAAFIAEPGSVIISADYSQIELRLLAHYADMPSLKKVFAEGRDIHAMTASEMFGVPVEGMDRETRRRAKAINFGIIYGISAFGLANQLGIERGEAAAYIAAYFEKFPGIRDYMERMKAACREHGYVETLFGRRCYYPDINARNPSARNFAERQSINAPLQGSAADIIRRAMIRMPDALNRAGLSARMLLQVHDELVFEAPGGGGGEDRGGGARRDGGRGGAGRASQRAPRGGDGRGPELGGGALRPGSSTATWGPEGEQDMGWRSKPSPARAAAHLVANGFVEIRQLAHKAGEHLAEPSNPKPAELYDALARIYRMADICHGLGPALAESSSAKRERMAKDALLSRWAGCTPESRSWILRQLSELGPEYEALFDP
jgi:DNA polymerase-1